MRIISSNSIVHIEGQTLHKERGANIRRVNVQYEHVREPVIVGRPQLEDFNSLVVIHDKMEFYS
ncbi:MAG: hypothetical protein LBR61_12475 [Synergistaceae bacterium]|jgi:hypothetical protein|nr:hypothetical protein [Synergistaceae bacterium]